MLTREQFILNAIASDTDDYIIWPFAIRQSNGYAAHSNKQFGITKNYEAHNYVCKLVHGEPELGEEAAHKCGQKLCINPKHLKWASPLDNMKDAKSHKTLRGGGRYRQRFFEPELAEIRASKESHIALASKYNTDPAYIGRLRRMG